NAPLAAAKPASAGRPEAGKDINGQVADQQGAAGDAEGSLKSIESFTKGSVANQTWRMAGGDSPKGILSLAMTLDTVGKAYLLDGLFLGALGVWVLYVLRMVAVALARLPVTRADLVAASLLALIAVPAFADEPTPEKASELPTIYLPYESSKDPLKANQVYLP